ncbi:unnamed protein product, partial [Ectocarpus sp. 4 AP-2014]
FGGTLALCKKRGIFGEFTTSRSQALFPAGQEVPGERSPESRTLSGKFYNKQGTARQYCCLRVALLRGVVESARHCVVLWTSPERSERRNKDSSIFLLHVRVTVFRGVGRFRRNSADAPCKGTGSW